MTPIPFLIAAAILAVIGAIIVVCVERAEDRERRKLANYRQAESLQRARGKFTTVEYYPTRGI